MNLGNYIVPDETKNGVCIDVGCNLGDFTNKYINHFNKIYFIEPQSDLFRNLVFRFKHMNNVVGFNNAVWSDSNLQVELLQHPNNDHGSVAVNGDYINNDWTENVVNTVETISLEDLLNQINEKEIDYLKIDCETSEYPFLIGKDLTMFKYIGMEIHSQMGIQKHTELLNWVKQTHDLINGNDSFTPNTNKEILFKLK
jgi:FkbM family methyltransferase